MDAFLYDQFADIDRRHWWFVARRQIVASVLRQQFGSTPPGNILDVGCGTGGMLSMLTEFAPVVCGMDMSDEAIAYCRTQNFPESVQLYVGSLPDDMPKGIDAWEVVTAFDVIEHLDDDRKTIQDAYSVLKPGGIFVCTVPAFEFLWGPHDDLNHHKRRYTSKDLLSKFNEAGFTIVKSTYFNSLLFPVVAAVRLGRRAIALGRKQEPKSDFTMPSPGMNNLLIRAFGTEAGLLKTMSLPVGVSLLVIGQKPAAQK
jgi:2-polyprenyl-3-methyl-5-hydroxy-6-metoxy-1,4-benzoquinol methylase